MLSIRLTAQTTLNKDTGKVETTAERIKNAARIMKDWKRLDSVVQVREKQLKDAQVLVDSLRIQLAVQTQLSLSYLKDRNKLDEQINQLANEEVSVWKGLSKGLHLDSSVQLQFYDISKNPIASPFIADTQLTYSWNRYNVGVSAAIIYRSNGNLNASGMLVVGFRWF